jgi:hypothetical protein
MKKSAAEDVAALEARRAAAEACTSVEMGFAAYRVDLPSDLTRLCEAYERNIQSLSDICSPITSLTPSAEDYIHWLTSKVGYLPEVFASVNENFVSTAVGRRADDGRRGWLRRPGVVAGSCR